MPLVDIYRAVRAHTRDQRNSLKANDKSLGWRITDVFARTWDLGFTSFGGPPVHFQILHHRFVEGGGGYQWIDEQTVSLSVSFVKLSVCSEKVNRGETLGVGQKVDQGVQRAVR
jgi:hypothetical protein